jgi:TatD DNase family protein
MQYIDTHAHLNLSAFTTDSDIVTQKCADARVGVINIGTTQATSKRAVVLADAHPDMYAIVGLHPIQTVGSDPDDSDNEPAEVFDTRSYRELAHHNKVVGIGECGFDYWHCAADTYAVQEAAFIAQIQLANELQLPLMIHTRGPKPGDATPTGRSVYADVYAVLKQYASVPFNVHFYAGTYEEAKHFFDIGGTVSFTGVITFAKVYQDLVCAIPLDLMHAETDCPYVAPVPYRGQRCEPWMVQEVYKKIASIRNENDELVREQLILNAARMYKIAIV